MTVEGVMSVPLAPPSREEQLEKELAEARAELERLKAEVAGYPHKPSGDQALACMGGGLIYEADGWIWVLIFNTLWRVGRATDEGIKHANAVRAFEARMEAEAMAPGLVLQQKGGLSS